ncbi:MAG TPA: hypothetical protein VNF68_05245, partial [Candidatus Baltobacteraceae bacterium]|nr:hypothetical protein [Candidatus Baltobacteraceae bacterium]
LSSIAGSINASRIGVASAVMAHGSQALAQLDAVVNAQAANLSAASTMQFFALATIATTLLPMLMIRRAIAGPVVRVPPMPVKAIRGEVRELAAR